MNEMRGKSIAMVAVALAAVSVRADDSVGGGALDKNAAKVRVAGTAVVGESYRYGVNLFDRGWEFLLRDFRITFCKTGLGSGGNCNGIPNVLAPDPAWKTVDIPHDWMLATPVSKAGRNGFRAVGERHPENSVGWYRKRFAVPAAFDGGRVYLQFDGIYRDSMAWVNGVYLGRNESGYIGRRYEITDLLRYGGDDNTVAVRVDASRTTGWWYDGAGMYRHAKLIVKRADFIRPDSLYFRTLSLDGGRAKVCATAEAEGRGRLEFELDGRRFARELVVENPRLWSPDDPQLYRLTARLVGPDGAVFDEETVDVGIRVFRFDAAKGLFVNDRPVKVKGVCCHQDMGCVGVAVPDALQDYRARLLKGMGVNADRTCHNPPTPEFLDACDRHGIMVMDEQRLFAASDEGLDQLRRLVLRDRNHPSVVAWSIGNEEHNVQGGEIGARMARRMKSLIRALDPDRVVTYGGNNGTEWKGNNSVVDVRGVNYIMIGSTNRAARVIDAPDRYHAAHPDQPVWGSEESSVLSTRGSRERWSAQGIQLMVDGDGIADNVHFGWVSSSEELWNYALDRDWYCGPFLWTGFDYRGECRWPATVNNFGVMDLCGFPKANYWYYRANWTDEDVLYVYPDWNRPVTNLVVNSNCEAVELFVNGKSVGRKACDRRRHLNFPVVYEPGEVVAKGIRGGREVTFRMATTGRAVRFVAEPDRTALRADGADATVVNYRALDVKGNEVGDCCDVVEFEASGAGKIIGVGNGNPLSHDDEVVEGPRGRVRFFNGRCQIAVKAGDAAGDLVVRARFCRSAAVPAASVETKIAVR